LIEFKSVDELVDEQTLMDEIVLEVNEVVLDMFRIRTELEK